MLQIRVAVLRTMPWITIDRSNHDATNGMGMNGTQRLLGWHPCSIKNVRRKRKIAIIDLFHKSGFGYIIYNIMSLQLWIVIDGHRESNLHGL
jgi:hypothetical protein